MVIEDAHGFYERAVIDFIKHDDADSAADLHFAVLNLTKHGYNPLMTHIVKAQRVIVTRFTLVLKWTLFFNPLLLFRVGENTP